MAQQPRVVITGLGVVAPNGIGKEAYWEGLTSGRSGVDRITLFEATGLPCNIAAEVKGFEPSAYMSRKEAKRVGRVSQFAIAAAKMAIADANIQVTPDHARHIGVCFAAAMGKPEVFETDYNPYTLRGIQAIHPTTFFEISPHAVSSHVAMAVGSTGVCGTLAMGCTSGLDVVQWAISQIQQRRAHIMVVGSAEAMLSPFAVSVVAANGILTHYPGAPQAASRPFERDRDGIVLSEGCGAMILESLDHARERNVPIYAELLGCAGGRGGVNLVAADLDGVDIAQVMETALYQAGIAKTQIDYINAHGNGLRDYDTAECNAIKTVFGQQAYHIPVSSIKSMIGQPFSAGGSLQMVASCLTMQNGLLTPTINYEHPDPVCDLDFVPNRARRARVRHLLVHAHGIGGSDAVVVLGKVGL